MIDFEKTASQEERILAHLQRGHTLTPTEALTYFGCFRLAARVHGLRRQGHAVQMRLTKAGHAEYFLPAPAPAPAQGQAKPPARQPTLFG
jgi:hypothetical protein